MNRDRLLGVVMLVGCVVGILLYGWLLFFVGPLIVLQVTSFIVVFALTAVVGWIGYTLATTPPPEPIESFETPSEFGVETIQKED